MTVQNENLFSNPEVFAETPPPPPERPQPPREVLTAYWYAERIVKPFERDTCSTISQKVEEKNTFLQFFIRSLQDQDLISRYNSRLQAGMISTIVPRNNKLTSGTFIRSSGSLISTPYHGTDQRFVRNGVQGHPLNIREGSLVYFWNCDDRELVRPMPDGSVTVTSLSHKSTQKVTVYLPVVSNEVSGLVDNNTRYANDQINAFTLVLGVESGQEFSSVVRVGNGTLKPPTNSINSAAQSQTSQPWKITVRFGEVQLELEEGRPEARITFNGVTYMYTINPGSSRVTRTDAGYRSYELTFIPVWNGILFSDSSPSSPNWSEKVLYLKKSNKVSMYDEFETEFNRRTNPSSPIVPRYDYGANLPSPPTQGSILERSSSTADPSDDPFSSSVDTSVSKGCFLPGKDETTPNFGKILYVDFERCGGSVRFLPVFFAKAIRSYLFMRGENPAEESVGLKCPNWAKVKSTWHVPVYHYSGGDSHFTRPYVWIVAGSEPIHVLALELERVKWGYRRPIETWGSVVAFLSPKLLTPIVPSTQEGDVSELIFRTAEGRIRSSSLVVPKIRRVSITRGLDGTSGNIEWDRFDPALGLFPRPNQEVGAIRLIGKGGVNTTSGVVFTGIAMGNGSQDTPDTNSVTIPLHGREVKMTDSEGGLRMINAPFFDGYDHRDVMQWMCDYVSVPFKTFATPYRLPSGTIMSPVINIKTGEAVWNAMQEIAKFSSTIIYFDRFGVLNQYNVGTTTGVNWFYPQHKVETIDDKIDLTQMRDTIVVAGLVGLGEIDISRILNPGGGGFNPDVQPMMVAIQQTTSPAFPWSKMLFYAIQGILRPNELRRAASEIARSVARPRAVGNVTIPGNAHIELLDTFNTAWAVTSITHNFDQQAKTWQTSLSLEMIMGVPHPEEIKTPPPAGSVEPPLPQGDFIPIAGTDPFSELGLEFSTIVPAGGEFPGE